MSDKAGSAVAHASLGPEEEEGEEEEKEEAGQVDVLEEADADAEGGV